MEGKKVIVVMAIVVVAAVALLAYRVGIIGGRPKPVEKVFVPPPTMLMDMKPPYTVMTKTMDEWKKIGTDGTGHYMNPDTKEFTMVTPLQCASCGKLIPVPQYPQSLNEPGHEAELSKVLAEARCPLCGRNPLGL